MPPKRDAAGSSMDTRVTLVVMSVSCRSEQQPASHALVDDPGEEAGIDNELPVNRVECRSWLGSHHFLA